LELLFLFSLVDMVPPVKNCWSEQPIL
jgi:hypothetical protein